MFLHTFFVLVGWMKIMNIGNVISVSFMTMLQQVIVVSVADISEYIMN